MNKIAKSIINPLIVVVVGGLIVFFVTLKKPDVRYTLSEEIPLTFSASDSTDRENVQQLEIKNIGSAAAEKIVVKMSGIITNFAVIKHISSDVVDVYINQQPVEFVYPSLPPEAGFKIIFTSPTIIEYGDIEISHNTGEASEALSQSSKSRIYIVGIYVLIIGSYLIWLTITIRNVSLNSWIRTTRDKRIELALEVTKPWYVSDSKWPAIHCETINGLLKIESIPKGKIVDSASFRLLNSEKPEHIDNNDWKDLKDLAIDIIKKHLKDEYVMLGKTADSESYKLLLSEKLEHLDNNNRRELITLAIDILKDHLSKSIETYSESSVLNVMRLVKPEHFHKDEWDTIQTEANKKYIELKKRWLGNWFSTNKDILLQLYNEEKPDAVPDQTWDELRIFYQDSYFDGVIHEIYSSNSPKDVLAEYESDILDQEQITQLQKIVDQISKYHEYQRLLDCVLEGDEISEEKPNSISDWDWQKLNNLEMLFVQIEDKKIIIDDLLQGSEISEEKPDSVSDSEWQNFKNFETRITQLKDINGQYQKLQKEKHELVIDKEMFLQIKDKVTKQLEFINDLLNDPSIIDRIESYDDTFSPGNLDNLREISKILMHR